MPRRQNFVTFSSPGTFFHEETTKPVETWETATAVLMARSVKERYGAAPFMFRFSSKIVAEPIPDGEGGTLEVLSKQVDRSDCYFMGGTILSYQEVMARNDPRDAILLANMRSNDIAYVIENESSCKSVNAFDEKCVMVDPTTGAIVERGDALERMVFRAQFKAEREAELQAFLDQNEKR